MRNVLNMVLFLILPALTSFSQTDTIMYLEETDFTLYKMHKVKYQETGEIKRERQVISFENAELLIFLNNDSLALTSETGSSVFTQLQDIQDVSKYKKRLSPVLGITLGALGGGVLGGVIGWQFQEVSRNQAETHLIQLSAESATLRQGRNVQLQGVS